MSARFKNGNSLKDFQVDAVNKLVRKRNVLIGDEMGLGKSYEGIALDLLRRVIHKDDEGERPLTLVIAPLSVLSAWQQHFDELTDLKFVLVNPKDREGSWDLFLNGSRAWNQKPGDVFGVHWEALRLMPQLKDFEWFHVIADECHRAQSRNTRQTLTLKAIQCQYKTAMSGTPVTNTPDKLWSILNWLYPKEYASYWRFFHRYVDFVTDPVRGFKVIKGVKDADKLAALMEPFYIRRLKKDVLKDLPDKYYTTIEVELGPKQRKAYDQMRYQMLAWVGAQDEYALAAPIVIAQLTRLQQFSDAYVTISGIPGEKPYLTEPSAKLDALMDLLDSSGDEQIVIFTQFASMVKLIEKRLEKAGESFVSLTGSVPQKVRPELIAQFQSGKARIFVGSIAAGGVGITLTAASTVVFVDRSWSPAINEQAEDRLHRIGQENAVQVIDLIGRDTVDLGRRARLELKSAWLREILGDKVDKPKQP